MIVSSPAPARTRRRFDPWPTHAIGTPVFGGAACNSGRVVLFLEAELSDGQVWNWAYRFFEDFVEFYAYQSWANSWSIENGTIYGFGEWFNWTWQPVPFDKIPNADWSDWLLAH